MNKPRIAEYRGQIFIYTKKEIEFENEEKRIIENVKQKGSFHTYYNNGLHNYNDFYFSDLKNIISDLCCKFNINPETTDLNNLEFGVNIYIPISPEEFFNYVLNYKETPFYPFTIKDAKGICCKRSKFYIKMYDKGNHYNVPGNLLRFEIHVSTMQFFLDHKVKIKTIADLLNITELCKLKPILRGIFDDILFYDYSIDESKLSEKERLILSHGTNKENWEKLHPKSKNFENGNKNPDYNKQRKKYYRDLDRFKKLINDYSTSTLQKDISFLIEKKCSELLTIENKKRDKCSDISEQQKTIEKGQPYISNIVNICPINNEQENRICPVTELDISMQKPGSKFLSKTGLKYYFQNEKEIYNQLSKRLSQKWINEPLETQFTEIAHSVRNEFYNIKNNTLKSIYKVNENSLFDSLPFISPNKLNHAGMTG